MNFKNNISTTREQSERLLSLGVKPETADMVYHHTNSRSPFFEWELQPYPPTLRGDRWPQERINKLATRLHKHPDGTPMTGEEVFDSIWGQDVPSWSLSRLLEMMSDRAGELTFKIIYPVVGYFSSDVGRFYADADIFNNCVDMIEWLIKGRYFNQDYLIHSNSSKTGKEETK